VRLGPSTPGDDVRARVLVPRNPGVTIRDGAVSLVIILLLDSLCLFQPMADISEELFALLHGSSHCRNTCVPRFIGPDGRRLTPVDDLERRVAERALVGGVEDVLRPWLPLEPLARPIAR
jgi:hypothetical protein